MMKREYMKPYLAVESFQLDAAIAGACAAAGGMVLAFSANDCTVWDDKGEKIEGEYIFGAACEASHPEDEGFDVVGLGKNPDGGCYQVFSDAPGVALES